MLFICILYNLKLGKLSVFISNRMLAPDFIDYLHKLHLETGNNSPEDFSDKLNLFTSLLFMISAVVVTLKQYVFNSMSCYIPVHPTGKDFENFLSDYCWVHGTIPLRPNEPMPKTPEEWEIYEKQRRISSIGIEDFGDRLNFFTTILFLIATLIVTVKQYVLGAMSCYVSVSPSGTGFETFLVNYCWVHGTIPLRSNEPLPETDAQWKDYDTHRRINFIELFAKYNYANRVAVEDFSDRLSLFTVVLFLIACIVVSAKQYFLNSISCYIPVKPTGENYNAYLTDYCWVHGTIPLRPDEPMPTTPKEWEQYDQLRRITYYQWVPFVLGLQCIFFYIPHIAWQAVCAHRSGGDLFALVKAAADAAISERGSRKSQVKRVAEFLEDMIDGHKDCRHGRRMNLTRRAYDMCGICVVSKRLGTCLVFSYICVKLITIINAIMQVYLIQRFLGFYADGSAGHKSMQLGKTYEASSA
ncbi:hypothetical protein MN116_004290, partial [Schistosoma mekongi]